MISEALRTERALLPCNGSLRGRKEDDRIDILRNTGADVSPLTLVAVHPDCYAAGRIGISRCIPVVT